MKIRKEKIFAFADSATAFLKEISYADKKFFLDKIQSLIDHKLLKVIEHEPQIFNSMATDELEISNYITLEPCIPEMILELEQEVKTLKGYVDVFKTCFQKGEKVLNDDLQKVYNLTKEIK